ncbi:hypothetical protein B7463_g4495, partial [Scytalidium lignicola]
MPSSPQVSGRIRYVALPKPEYAPAHYRETALKLQKEWNVQDPQHLSFAPHVKNHALVAVLNKGLLFNAVEREVAPANCEQSAPEGGFFGPLTPTSPAPADEEDYENARKRQIEEQTSPTPNEPLQKRPRLSNGYENGFESTPMEVDGDQNTDGHAYPSPELVSEPIVVTNGPEQGTQVEKVAELRPETTFLDLSDELSSKNTVLLQCEWNPRDPTILAAAGTDALARMWTISRTTTDLNGNDDDVETNVSTISPPHVDLLEDGLQPSTTVTGISWTSDGTAIAVASEPQDDGTSRINVWSVDGRRFLGFDGFESPVICLRWNLSNTAFLALSPEKGGTLITVMAPSTRESIRYSMPKHDLMEQPLDVAWTGDDEFIICGSDLLQAFKCSPQAISPFRKYETREDHGLSKIMYDWRSNLLATASETGMIDIWDQQGQCHSFNAHQGPITALAWQPLQTPALVGEDVPRLLASSGEDGAISIWNARSSETKSRCSMTMGSGVVALAFTPDGAFIAGATNQRILIWKVDDVNIPRASWTRGSGLGWQTPQSNDSAPDEDQHSLSWDANGQKLAYGVNSLLAVINFRR